ncbi:GNAT family N-acetyltransferase [Achromobacter pulmonis]|uniref:GNAT family N-acetyltransferase n=1 Tax=Achromobacter pulmonis TaxID=1389932 RepID=A0A2N8KL83_9BURK|nr:N-acetyltransferase [Achromobacter pulmonis]MBO9329044.1 GNAT family N-acetyltransferase [Achromobacter xylosoxidans]PND34215.1 GNAT family N-acetyltransferase [Achromobacter pulmonis]
MQILPESPGDRDAIFTLTQAAFKDHPHSAHTEGHIIDALREAGALTLSLVARLDGRIAGHVAFSPVAIGDGSPDWYGLGPVAVLPELQGRGIGAALIRAGIAGLKSLGAAGCVVMGDPAYYRRFGFAQTPALTYPGVPPEYFMAQVFTRPAQGQVTYHKGFEAAA